MLVKKVKKLWQGQYVSVRDYEAQSAVSKGGMVIEHGRDSMTISVDGLKIILEHGKKSQLFKSKTGGKDYYLIDITFKADTENDPDQMQLI
jgi:hypothetical protein